VFTGGVGVRTTAPHTLSSRRNVPDCESSSTPIARSSLAPILEVVAEVLEEEHVSPSLTREIFSAVAEAYVVGHLDGQRQAVGEIAPVAEKHGLELKLAPNLERPATLEAH
jgi:hypothetical protein